MAPNPLIKTPEATVRSPMGRKFRDEKVTLIDILDKVLETGAVISGDVAIRMADVDLIYLGLRIILTSISKAEELSGRSFSNPHRPATPEEIEYLAKLSEEIKKSEVNIAKNIEVGSPKKAEKGIAQLVLTIVELVRRLTERESFRRVQRGNLSQIEIQKLGMSLKAMEKKIKEIQTIFGIEDEELNLNLGPLGSLM